MTEGSWMWKWTHDDEYKFGNLQKVFRNAPILQHLDPQTLIVLKRDGTWFKIAGIFNLYTIFWILCAVNFFFGHCISAEQYYYMYDLELLVIVERITQWRHCLEGAKQKTLIPWSRVNWKYVRISIVLFRRQAWWHFTLLFSVSMKSVFALHVYQCQLPVHWIYNPEYLESMPQVSCKY